MVSIIIVGCVPDASATVVLFLRIGIKYIFRVTILADIRLYTIKEAPSDQIAMEKSLTIEKYLDLTQSPEKILSTLLPTLVNLLNCDRCFLYLRNPETKLGKVPFCWCRSEEILNVSGTQLKPEPAFLPEQDPLFAAALRNEPAIFVEDVETASPDVVNRDFEQRNFGHRALIHAHLCQYDRLWGVLQPCVFGQPRHWSDFDRELIDQVVQLITPVAVTYVKANFRD